MPSLWYSCPHHPAPRGSHRRVFLQVYRFQCEFSLFVLGSAVFGCAVVCCPRGACPCRRLLGRRSLVASGLRRCRTRFLRCAASPNVFPLPLLAAPVLALCSLSWCFDPVAAITFGRPPGSIGGTYFRRLIGVDLVLSAISLALCRRFNCYTFPALCL